MKFNTSKCQIMRIHRSTKAVERLYTIIKQIFEQVDKAKYLGVMNTEELDEPTYKQYCNKSKDMPRIHQKKY